MQKNARRTELGRFLRDRRARLRPSDVGLPERAGRRVVGLRREEVAALAGLGVTWYTMLENGTASNVSGATLDAIARALRLQPDERAYLQRLAEERTADEPDANVGALTRDALAAIHYAPAYVCTSLWTVLAWNRAMSLVWGLEAPGGRPFNIVVRMFADEAMRAMHGARFRDFAGDLVAMVRASAAAHLERDAYREMVDALRADALFASLWDAYEVVRPIRTTSTEVVSATVGIFTYRTLTLEVPDDREHWIVLQIPDAPSLRRLRAKLDESDGDNN